MKTSNQNIENHNQQPLPMARNNGNKKVTLVLREKELKNYQRLLSKSWNKDDQQLADQLQKKIILAEKEVAEESAITSYLNYMLGKNDENIDLDECSSEGVKTDLDQNLFQSPFKKDNQYITRLSKEIKDVTPNSLFYQGLKSSNNKTVLGDLKDVDEFIQFSKRQIREMIKKDPEFKSLKREDMIAIDKWRSENSYVEKAQYIKQCVVVQCLRDVLKTINERILSANNPDEEIGMQALTEGLDSMDDKGILDCAKEYCKRYPDNKDSRLLNVLLQNSEQSDECIAPFIDIHEMETIGFKGQGFKKLQAHVNFLSLPESLIKKIKSINGQNYRWVLFSKDEVSALKKALALPENKDLAWIGDALVEDSYMEQSISAIVSELETAKRMPAFNGTRFLMENKPSIGVLGVVLAMDIYMFQQFVAREKDTLLSVGGLAANMIGGIYMFSELLDGLSDQVLLRVKSDLWLDESENKVFTPEKQATIVQMFQELSGSLGAMGAILSVTFGLSSWFEEDPYSVAANVMFGIAALKHWIEDSYQVKEMEQIRKEARGKGEPVSTLSHVLRRSMAVGVCLSSLFIYGVSGKLEGEMTSVANDYPLNYEMETAVFLFFSQNMQLFGAMGLALAASLFVDRTEKIRVPGMMENRTKTGLNQVIEEQVKGEGEPLDYNALVDEGNEKSVTYGEMMVCFWMVMTMSAGLGLMSVAMVGVIPAWARENRDDKGLISNQPLPITPSFIVGEPFSISIPYDTYTMDTAMKDTYFNDYESSEFTEVNKAALERFNKDDILQLRADIGGVEVSDTIKDKINAEGYKTELYTRDEIALLKAAMSRHSKETIRNLGEKVAEINQYVFNHFKYEGKQSNLKDLPKWMDFQAPNIKEKRSGKLSGTPSDQDVGDQQRWQLQIIGYDGFGGKGTQQVTLAKNTRPILVNPLVSPEVLLAGQTLNYVIPNNAFSDNDGDALSYSATYNGGALPSWLTFDKNTRVLSGASNVGGQWVIDITANDGKGGVVSGQITVQVAQSNIAPIIINSLVNPAIIETGSMFSYTVPLNTFFDPDGDSLTYRATYNDGPLPSWLSFNADTRTFSGAPIGTNEWEIKVIAEDGKGGSISDTVLFRSNNVPLLIHSMVDPPIITTGNAFNYTVPSNTFFDPDGDSLTYRATYNDGPLPSWLTFNADTRTFSGTPTTTGDWEIKVYAEDTKGAKVSDTILIRSNNIPMVQQALTDPGTFTTNQLFSYTMPATTFFDPDGDTLTYTATYNGGDLPNWLSFNANTRTLSGTPQAVGEWRIDITATDTKGATVSDALNLRCKGLDPVLEAALNYRKNYVSETDWKDYFGCTETNYPGISDSINDILNSDCLFTPGKKVYETHLLYFFPSTCSGNDVTIRSQAALWSTNTGTMPYSDHAKLRVTSFSSQPDYEVQFQTADWSNRNADNHQWVLLYVGDPNIENGAIPGSRRKSWSDQQALFNSKNDGNYEIVKPIELVTGVMMKYIKTGEKIISDDPRTSLRTINEWTRYGHPEYRLVIGPFDNDGPYFAGNGKSDDYAGYINGVLYDDSLGIGICRKLN